MRTTMMLGVAGLATAGTYFVARPDNAAHHERIINQPPKLVFNVVAIDMLRMRNRTQQGYPHGPDGPKVTISYRYDAKPGESASLDMFADGKEIATFDFSLKPIDDGRRTSLSVDIDFHGETMGLKPSPALQELTSGRAIDSMVAAIESGRADRFAQLDYESVLGMVEQVESAQRGITPQKPSMGVAMARRERERAMDAAVRPMVDPNQAARRAGGKPMRNDPWPPIASPPPPPRPFDYNPGR